MGWILLHTALLFSLHITGTLEEQEQNKDISETGHRSLGSFLRNVLDSSQELAKIRNEVRANEEMHDAVHQHSVNNEFSQTRQKRKAKVIPEVKVADRAAKDPHLLRRVLNLYMKRAQMFRHGKGQNLVEDTQQKFSENQRGKREFHSMYVVIPSGNNLQKTSDKYSQGCRHKQSSSERKKIRRRRWRYKSNYRDKNEAQNSNNEKSSPIVDNKIDIVNTEAVATSDTQSNYPLSNIYQKGSSAVQNLASYKENTLSANSMVSKQTGNVGSSANSPPSVVSGSGYDLDCVHEMPSLEGSLLYRNFKGTSSLTDNFSNVNNLKPTNNIALNGQEAPLGSKSSLVAQTENINDQMPLNEMANKQEKTAEAPEQTSFSSDAASSGETLDIVNPIVLEVLEKVSKATNETNDNDGGITSVKNMRLPEVHEEIQAKTSTDNFSRQKSTRVKNKYESNIKDSIDKNKVASLGNFFKKSHENDLAKKQPLKSKTFQMSRENDLKNGQSIGSKSSQISDENDLTKSLSNSGQDFSGKSDLKQERVPISNIKGKSSHTQKSEWSESLSVHKTPHSNNKPFYKPAAPITNSAHKGLALSGQQKLEKVAAPVSLYTKNHASLPKSKLDSDIILRTELLHGSKSDKVSINQSKAKNKAKNSEVSLKYKTKNVKQKRNAVEETSGLQKNTEDVELQNHINKRNSREINGNALISSENNVGENENIKSSNDLFASDNHDQMDAEEAGQDEDIEKIQQSMDTNKRSLKLNEEKQQEELIMPGDTQNIVQENNLSIGHQSKFSQSLRSKRHASRFRKHLRKGKRHYQQEGDSKLNSDSKYPLKEYNISPYKHMAKHTDSENKEDSVHQNMLKQVEDMILALKEENHKAPLKYDSGFNQRIGRRLHSMIDEARDTSDGTSDNDDYYYYDEDDVDKRRPEHSKVSQNINRQNTLDKLDSKSMRKTQIYVQKQFGRTSYLNAENPTNLHYSNNNDPSLNPMQSEHVFSDLITSESNKISRFNKKMPEDLPEARYNRNVAENERGRDYEKNIMENNSPQSSSSRKTDEANQNSSANKNNPRRALRKIITTNENQQITRLNEGKLEQQNIALNEIVLNQTATSWNDIGQDEIGYNAHMRYKRASNAIQMDTSPKREDELGVKKENIADETTKIKQLSLEKRTNLGARGKENKFLASADLSNIFNLQKEDKNYKTTASQSDILSLRINSSFIPNNNNNNNNSLNATALNYTKNDYNRHNNQNSHRIEVAEYNWNIVENNKGAKTKSSMQIPLSTNNGNTNVIINDQNGEFNVSEHSNVTGKNEHNLQHLQNVALSNDALSRGNYIKNMLPKDAIHLENIIGQHEDKNKESGDQKFNSPTYSYDKNIETNRNKKFSVEKMLNNEISGNESTKNITKIHENSKLETADAKSNISRYESLTTEKQHLSEVLQDSVLSPNNMTKVKEMSLESSKVLLRNKRNGEEYIDQTLEELPDYSDYSSDSEMDGYIHDNSTSGEAIIVHIVLDTTESTTESISSGNTNTPLSATQHTTYNMVDNSKYVTLPVTTIEATESRENLPASPKPYQGDSDKQNAEKISVEYQSFNMPKDYNGNSLPTSLKQDQADSGTRNAEKTSVEYQSFNIPKDYNDNSQLNNTINGALASKMVDLVFEAVNASENLKHHLGGALKKTDYGSQEKQPNYETGISQEMLETEEEQYHQRTGGLLSKVMELLDVLVEEEVNKRSCISLQPDLREFLLWMLELPEPEKFAPSKFSVPDNFLFMKRNKRPHDKTKENKSVSESVPIQNMDLKELNQQIELLGELITEYLQLPDSEKAKVNYVHAFLTEQLQALERIRRSEIAGARSKTDDKIFNNRLSKSELQGTKGFDTNIKNAKSTQSKMRQKGKQHNLPNETPFKDSKHKTSSKEDSRYLKLMPEHEKPNSRYHSYDSEDYGMSNKNSFKTSSDQSSAHKWSKGRQHLIKSMVSDPENADISESHIPRNSVKSHQRQRRYGGHGHGVSKNKHRNITHLRVPTMRYRKLLKRVTEFRERRSGFI